MSRLGKELQSVLAGEPVDLAQAALVIAKLEYPRLDPTASLTSLAAMGDRAAERLRPYGDAPVRLRIDALNRLFYGEESFSGNRTRYDDFRNSLLNVVLERRIGIPISLAVVYMEVARRAGLDVFGVSFPGHFLLRVPGGASGAARQAVILDPFDGGSEVDERACRALLSRQAGDRTPFTTAMLEPCTTHELIARMLNNLKRAYVDQRSFPQARLATDLLLTIDPTRRSELRDRGLLAYHLDDLPAALRDLEDYLKVDAWTEPSEERDEIWEHVKTLRRRVASLN
jgi:regulator of sirC expression with transglutaminase-like and TPR domain